MKTLVIQPEIAYIRVPAGLFSIEPPDGFYLDTTEGVPNVYSLEDFDPNNHKHLEKVYEILQTHLIECHHEGEEYYGESA